jgi:hypothetical protein
MARVNYGHCVYEQRLKGECRNYSWHRLSVSRLLLLYDKSRMCSGKSFSHLDVSCCLSVIQTLGWALTMGGEQPSCLLLQKFNSPPRTRPYAHIHHHLFTLFLFKFGFRTSQKLALKVPPVYCFSVASREFSFSLRDRRTFLIYGYSIVKLHCGD